MGFLKAENYDGEKGYLERCPFKFHVIELDGKKYLFGDLANYNEGLYQIVGEGEDSAVVVHIKNELIGKKWRGNMTLI